MLQSDVPSNTVLAVYCRGEAQDELGDAESCDADCAQSTSALPGGSLQTSFAAAEAVAHPSLDAHAVFDALAAKFYTRTSQLQQRGVRATVIAHSA